MQQFHLLSYRYLVQLPNKLLNTLLAQNVRRFMPDVIFGHFLSHFGQIFHPNFDTAETQLKKIYVEQNTNQTKTTSQLLLHLHGFTLYSDGKKTQNLLSCQVSHAVSQLEFNPFHDGNYELWSKLEILCCTVCSREA